MLRVWKLHGMKLRTIYQVRLRDDSTTDADEREDLVFTQNQWGDLNVFSATGDLLARIDSWEHDHYWESSQWDEEENNVSEGYKYNTGPSFNYHDDDWNELARTTLRSNTSYLMML